MKNQSFAAVALLAFTPAIAAAESTTAPSLLSAFFGLDDSRQIQVRTALACQGFSAGDGMPVIFSHVVDPDTLDAEDFQVTRASGDTGSVGCVTLRPADDLGELRTALVIGQFGSVEDPPVSVEIIGDITSLDGTQSFTGAMVDVIPLTEGPRMIFAENVPPNYWSLGGPGDCPRPGLRSIVRAVWVGGITKPGGDEIDESEMGLYRVKVQQTDGTVIEVAPMAVGDLDDGDNNHELCLDVVGQHLSVSFPAGALTDPNEDLNPETEVTVSGTRSD